MKSSNNNEPLVSVIIPTKNNIRTIGKCLKSVKNQSYKNIELIVVDNHSTDGTIEIAKKYADRVYRKGPERSAQRNFGASRAKGKYLLIHDSDIYFDSNTVADCVDKSINHNADAVIIPERSIGIGYWTRVKAFEREFYNGNDYIESPRFFRSIIYKKLGGYNEHLTGPEDWDLMIRIREGGYKIERTLIEIEHDEGELKIVGSVDKKKYYAKSFRKYHKLHPIWYREQMSFFRRFSISKIFTSLITNPILLISMIFQKSLEFILSIVYVSLNR